MCFSNHCFRTVIPHPAGTRSINIPRSYSPQTPTPVHPPRGFHIPPPTCSVGLTHFIARRLPVPSAKRMKLGSQIPSPDRYPAPSRHKINPYTTLVLTPNTNTGPAMVKSFTAVPVTRPSGCVKIDIQNSSKLFGRPTFQWAAFATGRCLD